MPFDPLLLILFIMGSAMGAIIAILYSEHFIEKLHKRVDELENKLIWIEASLKERKNSQ